VLLTLSTHVDFDMAGLRRPQLRADSLLHLNLAST
jgi:hypothetical protein